VANPDRHALRPSTIALVTVAGLNVGALIGGAFLVEYIFALPGVGVLAIESIFSKDYLVVQGIVVVVAVAYVVVNFCVDLLYLFLDPRARGCRPLAEALVAIEDPAVLPDTVGSASPGGSRCCSGSPWCGWC